MVIFTNCQVLVASSEVIRQGRRGRDGAVSGLPAENGGDEDRGSMATVTCKSHRQRDSRWISEPRKEPTTNTKALTLSNVWSVLQRGTSKLWSAAQVSKDENLPQIL
ncbi:hypothetical protein PoB_003487200 [Plakobranchus ocellatus]|uniref:Uncharacterized protein n=1 Tax=Plakobranchus ocellatus TaxID=259542 RepID=A0AAV4AN58_9GAST|nr:hypothetical protein PoB_003487200 [Plakobranchus ocellatus]